MPESGGVGYARLFLWPLDAARSRGRKSARNAPKIETRRTNRRMRPKYCHSAGFVGGPPRPLIWCIPTWPHWGGGAIVAEITSFSSNLRALFRVTPTGGHTVFLVVRASTFPHDRNTFLLATKTLFLEGGNLFLKRKYLFFGTSRVFRALI